MLGELTKFGNLILPPDRLSLQNGVVLGSDEMRKCLEIHELWLCHVSKYYNHEYNMTTTKREGHLQFMRVSECHPQQSNEMDNFSNWWVGTNIELRSEEN